MSSDTQNIIAPFVKIADFASKPQFDVARLQLISELNQHKPHMLHTSVKDCGKRWTKVLEAIYSKNDGMLRGYRKFADHRNFRVGFIEKVLKKVLESSFLVYISGI